MLPNTARTWVFHGFEAQQSRLANDRATTVFFPQFKRMRNVNLLRARIHALDPGRFALL